MKYLLLDISGIIYRSFFALNKDTFHRSDGFPTNAILGTINIIKHLNKQFADFIFIACCDCSRKDLKRNENDADYKKNRKNADPILVQQFSHIFQCIQDMNITQLKIKGYEADDIIASFCKKYSSEENQIVIASNDKDMNQLLVYPNTTIYNMSKKKVITANDVYSKFNVTPEQFIFYQGLVGDKVDNIVGLKGVGPKTACKIIEKYKTPEQFWSSNDHKHQYHMDDFRNSLELVTLNSDLHLEEQEYTKQNLKSREFKSFCESMEIRH